MRPLYREISALCKEKVDHETLFVVFVKTVIYLIILLPIRRHYARANHRTNARMGVWRNNHIFSFMPALSFCAAEKREQKTARAGGKAERIRRKGCFYFRAGRKR